MKFGGAACCFACSCGELLWNSLDQIPSAFFSSELAGVNLRNKGGLRTHFVADGERRQWPLCISVNRLTNRVLGLLPVLDGIGSLYNVQRDLQSYLSHLNLFMASDSGKFYILVDNRPWLKDLVSRPTHLWQLMVTKSRLSPFANTKGRKDRKMIGELSELQASSSSNTGKFRNFKKWFSLIDALMLSRKRALLPVKKLRNSLIANSKLHRTLYGFIVFEVAWNDVRGINYLNELQTDTSLAIETKVMRRWEFDSITQAARLISSWFPGTLNEQILLKEHLDATLATCVIYPIIWILWEVLYAPFRLVFGVFSLVAFLCTFVYGLVGDLWLFASSIFNFTRDVESTVSSYEVFRALRSILHGFVAFFTACNRHRLRDRGWMTWHSEFFEAEVEDRLV
ncbi:UNVERIFIED_CONTAM: hypothetical protein Scaly_2231200 [Sesamum calycinum]|uniref:Uncharacterized protein n=1 Tax=Sesamum calycinum TaxID=2727403 RepID=A0AAW2MCW5_9LAMI